MNERIKEKISLNLTHKLGEVFEKLKSNQIEEMSDSGDFNNHKRIV